MHSAGIYGAGETINAQMGSFIVVGNTGSDIDSIIVSGDSAGGTTANGQLTGIALNAGSQADINGNRDAVYLDGNNSSVAVGSSSFVGINSGESGIVVYASGDRCQFLAELQSKSAQCTCQLRSHFVSVTD